MCWWPSLRPKSFVEHMKRMSNNKAVLVDRLLRESSVPSMDLAKIEAVPWLSPGGSLLGWITQPCLDWNLPVPIVKMESFS